MEKIKNTLLIIARKLNKNSKLLSDDDFASFSRNIDSYSIDELSRFACSFFNKAIYNKSIFMGVKDDFSILKDSFLLMPELNINNNNVKDKFWQLNSIIDYLNSKSYISFLSGYFDNKVLKDSVLPINVQLIVPSDELENILRNFFETGASVDEISNDIDPDRMPVEGTARFKDGVVINVKGYTVDATGDLIINEAVFNGNGFDTKQVEIPSSAIKLCFNKSGKNVMIATAEYTYINAIRSGKPINFIEATLLRKVIDLRKCSEITKKLDSKVVSIKEVVKNGLQRIS